LFEIGEKLVKNMAVNFFLWPMLSKIGQFKQIWPINWPSGNPDKNVTPGVGPHNGHFVSKIRNG
jgi:hypothetical protein